jgi:hypothetical protein
MWLVGRPRYEALYRELASAVEEAVIVFESAGVKLFHAQNRIKGSTVIGLEDPCGAIHKNLKKRHAMGLLFGMRRHDPSRCQSGVQVSFTPHALRLVEGNKRAIDAFVEDVVRVSKQVQNSPALSLARWGVVKEASLLPCILSGNVLAWLLPQLHRPGYGRYLGTLLLRSYFTANLDSGVIRSLKAEVLTSFLKRLGVVVALMLALGPMFSFRTLRSALKKKQLRALGR